MKLIYQIFALLICFDIVEYHYPARVMRQFGFEQTIPVMVDTSDKLHNIDRRSRNKNYEDMHHKYIEEWRKREDKVVSGDSFMIMVLLCLIPHLLFLSHTTSFGTHISHAP